MYVLVGVWVDIDWSAQRSDDLQINYIRNHWIPLENRFSIINFSIWKCCGCGSGASTLRLDLLISRNKLYMFFGMFFCPLFSLHRKKTRMKNNWRNGSGDQSTHRFNVNLLCPLGYNIFCGAVSSPPLCLFPSLSLSLHSHSSQSQ